MTTTITVARAQEVHSRASARKGLRYAYGGAFTTNPRVSTDCSGLVFQTAAWYMGRTDWSGNRYGSTESARLDYAIVYQLGLKRLGQGLANARAALARLPFKPVMLVGFQHGGGGVYSHTACTLMTWDRPGGPVVESQRGVDWESQGAGVFLYDGARSWDDRLFSDFWYLDGKLATTPAVNEIDSEAKRAGGWIGKRLSGELKTADGTGVYSDFENARVYFKVGVRANKAPGDRAIAVPPHLREGYDQLGSSAGPLGFPIERHRTVIGLGDSQMFERGMIYRRYGGEAIPVHGAILERFARAGFDTAWGWPLGPETPVSDGGRDQRFENLSARWHPSGVTLWTP